MLSFLVSMWLHPVATLLWQVFGDHAAAIADEALVAAVGGSPFDSDWASLEVSPDRRLQFGGSRGGDPPNPTDPVPLAFWAGNLAINVLGLLLCAEWYKSSIVSRRKPSDGFSQCLANPPGMWKYQTMDCFGDTGYCLFGCCCLSERLGDTYSMTGAGPGYWTWVLVMVMIQVIRLVLDLGAAIAFHEIGLEGRQQMQNAGNLFYFIPAFVVALWMAGRRKALRRALGDPNPDASFCNDFICYACCGCCMAIQEARTVDEATGVKTVCCMRLEELHPRDGMVAMNMGATTVVGQPVVGQPMQPAGQPVGTAVVQPVGHPSAVEGKYGSPDGAYGNAVAS